MQNRPSAWALEKCKAAPPLGRSEIQVCPTFSLTSPRVAEHWWSHPGPLVTGAGDSQAPWVVSSCVSVSNRMLNTFGKILSRKRLFRCVLACLGFLIFHHPIDNQVFDTKSYGIEYGTMRIIYSYSGDEMTLDGRQSDLRRVRSGVTKIESITIGVPKIIALIVP